MRIIIEGADGTGKTTLAKIYAEKYGLDICHCTQYDPTDYDFYRYTVRKNNVVWDRHTIGELIYPTVFNRKSSLGTEDVRLVLSYARELNTKIIILTSDLDTIISRLEKRGGEDNKILNNIKWINDQFVYYANQFNIPLIDTSKLTLQELFDIIEKPSKPHKFIHK